MLIVEAIAKRQDVSPKEGQRKYGNVTYADPKNKKYPLDTDAHVRAALSYWGMPKNRAKYSSADQKLIGARIRAAAKRRGIGAAAKKNGNGKTQAESAIVTCELPFSCRFEGEAPTQILYLPKGRSTISARVNGEPKTVTVEVHKEATAVLQADLEKRLAAPVRPVGGFNHKTDGPASFHPKSFLWDDARGVVLNVDWTKSGKDAIDGRDFSYFSPTFRMKDERIAGLTERGEVGSLTNSPAFEQIGSLN